MFITALLILAQTPAVQPEFDIRWGASTEIGTGAGYDPFGIAALMEARFKDTADIRLSATLREKKAYGRQTVYAGEARFFIGRLVTQAEYSYVDFQELGCSSAKSVGGGGVGYRSKDWVVLGFFRDDSRYESYGVTLEYKGDLDIWKWSATEIKLSASHYDSNTDDGNSLTLTWTFLTD